MSTGLLYHAFGVGSYQCQRTEYVKGQVVFSLGQSPAKWRCSVCNSAEVVGRGKTERRFRTLPIGRKSVTLVFAVPRVGCHRCGAVRQVKIGFADPRFSYTHAFERYALELSQHMTIKDVAQHLNVSWDVIKDIQKNPENLDPQRNEGQRLQQALRINQPLATAYYLKEDLRQFWDQPDKATATTFLADWCARAKASGVPMLRRFAKLLDHHEEGLLAYYEYRISTGPLEGTNNKIRTMQRQAYGFRDLDFFKLKIFDLHRTKYALVG
jgi:transposase